MYREPSVRPQANNAQESEYLILLRLSTAASCSMIATYFNAIFVALATTFSSMRCPLEVPKLTKNSSSILWIDAAIILKSW